MTIEHSTPAVLTYKETAIEINKHIMRIKQLYPDTPARKVILQGLCIDYTDVICKKYGRGMNANILATVHKYLQEFKADNKTK